MTAPRTSPSRRSSRPPWDIGQLVNIAQALRALSDQDDDDNELFSWSLPVDSKPVSAGRPIWMAAAPILLAPPSPPTDTLTWGDDTALRAAAGMPESTTHRHRDVEDLSAELDAAHTENQLLRERLVAMAAAQSTQPSVDGDRDDRPVHVDHECVQCLEHAHADADAAALHAQAATDRETIAALRDDLAMHAAQVSAMHQVADALKTEVDRVHSELERVQSSRAPAASSTDLDDLRAAHAALQDETRALQDENRALLEQRRMLFGDMDARLRALEVDVDRERRMRLQVASERDAARALVEELEVQLARDKSAVVVLQRQVLDLVQENDELKSKLERAQSQLRILQATVHQVLSAAPSSSTSPSAAGWPAHSRITSAGSATSSIATVRPHNVLALAPAGASRAASRASDATVLPPGSPPVAANRVCVFRVG
ncbi:hypothetical protein AMAG_18868 [Allomyces macrogynus ATCC 38327]|uniref:Autophagy-related protein 16 domain-containing protein n=1 Tax=Allomyces macrogynus (strain ATCC 38327) TaxID=578462 RepID=A0A0L0SJ19_ALLM3|nr:hypothetical protein AMAG_18868 [Allomyces macrogynus ATCC 38327]|eukprot:KNE62462.1 hypothetical protein AMAG_18868 [Allomyces macrogynus ATCC 38327]